MYHACLRLADATVDCWGSNDNGQLGDGTIVRRSEPNQIVGFTLVRQVTAGVLHSCATKTDGTVSCWGSNVANQLTSGCELSECRSPRSANLDGRLFEYLGAGSNFTCGITTTHGVACWGDNFNGQLGNGESGVGKSNALPVDVKDSSGTGLLSGATGLAVGDLFACAVNSVGVWCWGLNDVGQLGMGAAGVPQSLPVFAQGITDTVDSIAAGKKHACVTLAGGGIACWGKNDRGQLGNGESGVAADHASAVRVGGALNTTKVAKVALGVSHSCALTLTGAVYCWGDGANGRLGNNATSMQTTPVPITWP